MRHFITGRPRVRWDQGPITFPAGGGQTGGVPRIAALVALVLLPAPLLAQELEPRAYSNAPVGTNFVVAGYTHFSGKVLLDPALPVTDVDSRVDVYSLGYSRFFGLFGRSANFAVVLPYFEGDLTGNVLDAPAEVHRAGWGDLRLRGAINLFGHPALTPAEFAKRSDAPSGGASLSVIAPTGQYVPSRFINIGANRWAFKPEAGLSWPAGNWFAEVSGGVWLFTDNNDYAGGHRRSQEPLAVLQLHAGYNFRPGMWLAVDYGHYAGGRTALDGVDNDDSQRNSRLGAVFAVPVATGWSAKLGWSKGTIVRAGGDYRILTLALQYRFFD